MNEVSPERTISGAWVLDLSRSDTFESYLQCLGTPPQAILAQVTGEREYQSRNVIALDASELVIHKKTAINNFTERFELDEEQVTPTRPWNRPQDGGGGGGGGVNQVTVSLGESEQLDGYVVATTTSAPNGRPSVETVEVRQLTDGGLTHIQQIDVRNLLTGGQCTVMRVWVRVPMTHEDQAGVAPDA
ncbi:unnamed protein product [Ectocarpus sp. 12 AP-2014]